MRCIAKLDSLEEAEKVSLVLTQEEIEHAIEPAVDEAGKWAIWIVDEDKIGLATAILSRVGHSLPVPFSESKEVVVQHVDQDVKVAAGEKPLKLKIHKPRTLHPWGTYFLFGVCAILFIVAYFEKRLNIEENGRMIGELLTTNVQKQWMFDYPLAAEKFDENLRLLAKEDKNLSPPRLSLKIEQVYQEAQNTPSWQGIYPFLTKVNRQLFFSAPFAEKICKGQLWRLFTPSLLHTDLLHIVFNMAWLWMLGSQVENRLRINRFMFLVVSLGVFSNVCQYLMSGPFFLGFSGVVVGLAGFIWMRKKVAPWEGYSVHQNTLRFLFIFVMAMFFLELVAFALRFLSVVNISPNIANTAHVAGGFLGVMLGRSSFFSRRCHR